MITLLFYNTTNFIIFSLAYNRKNFNLGNHKLPLSQLLIFRFDLIFLMLDPQNEQFDRRLARHLVSLYYKSQDEENDEVMVR